MKPGTPRHEPDGEYDVLLTIARADFGSFIIQHYIRSLTWVVASHVAIVILLGSVWIRVGSDLGYSFVSALAGIGWSALGFVCIIPVHEAVHGAVYWVLGAKDIRYGISIRNMYAFAIAHMHVVSARELVWVGIAPFLVLTSLLTGCVAVLPEASFIFVGTIVLHTLGCAGDWTMLNYLWLNRKKELYMYDDADEGVMTYLAIRERER